MNAVDITRLIVLVILLVIEIFWFQMFRDMLQSDFLSFQEKRQWTIMFVLLNAVGSLIF